MSLDLLVIAPFWGMLSAQLFLQGTLGSINLVIALIGFVKGNAPLEARLAAIAAFFGMAAIYYALLALGIYVVGRFTSFGATTAQLVVFWILFAFSLWFMAAQFITKIHATWRQFMVPGEWIKARYS